MLQPKPLALNISNMEPGFSIGRYIKKKKLIKKKRKINLAYYGNNKVYNFTCVYKKRWQLPKSMNVSDSVKYKFSSLETMVSFRDIKFKIAENIRNMRFRFEIPTPWEPPQNIVSSINSFYAKEENDWNKVRAIYYRLFKLKQVLGSLIFRWQINKCIKNCKNIEDPVTMELPKQPVVIIDFKKRMSFVYDANTLKKTIENRLLFSDYMFPEPKEPLNLLTNQAFTYAQLISVVDQCKKYGRASWIMESFMKLDANLELFSFHNKQKLKLEAIKTYFKKPTYCLREVVIDYFNLEATYCELPNQQIYRFIKAYDTTPDMPIVQQWIGTTRDYYIAKELNEPVLLTRMADKIDNIINMIYKVFLYDTV
jgi:hypothetical protein